MGKISSGLSNKFANMSVVAALAVVLIHCYQEGDKGTMLWWVTELIGGGRWLTGGLVRFAVPFFFLASGFFLAGHIGETGWWKRAVVSRVRTLLVPYVVWLTIACCMALVVKICRGAAIPDWHWWLKSYGVVNQGFPILKQFWFLKCLFILIVISPVLARCARPFCILLFFIAYCLVVINPLHFPSWVTWLFGNTLSLEGMSFFILGIYLRQSQRFDLEKLPKAICFAAISISIVSLLAYAILDFYASPFARVVRWFAVPFLVMSVWGLVPSRKWPTWLTSSAFPIYLIHMFPMFVFSALLKGERVQNGMTGLFVTWCACAVLSGALSLCVRRCCPRMANVLFGGR